jgi:hypothetical protein
MYYLVIENHEAGEKKSSNSCLLLAKVFSRKDRLFQPLWAVVKPKLGFIWPPLLCAKLWVPSTSVDGCRNRDGAPPYTCDPIEV